MASLAVLTVSDRRNTSPAKDLYMKYQIKQLGVGGILDQSINLLRNHFGLLFGIVATTIIPVQAQGQRAHWVAMARWAASAMLIYFVIESSVSSG